jgi:hypothetical protein
MASTPCSSIELSVLNESLSMEDIIILIDIKISFKSLPQGKIAGGQEFLLPLYKAWQCFDVIFFSLIFTILTIKIGSSTAIADVWSYSNR